MKQPRPSDGVVLRKPVGSAVEVKRRGNRLEIDIPPAKFNGERAAHQRSAAPTWRIESGQRRRLRQCAFTPSVAGGRVVEEEYSPH